MTDYVTDTECERVTADLLAMMSLPEKVGQLVASRLPLPEDRLAIETLSDAIAAGRVGILHGAAAGGQIELYQQASLEKSRLGIPLLFAGATHAGVETIMPCALSTCASWDIDAIEKAEAVVSHEAQSLGLNWALSPSVQLTPAHSVGAAGEYGSEPHLAGLVAAARVRGMQGASPRGMQGLLACLDLGGNSTDARDLLSIACASISGAGVGSIAASGLDQAAGRRFDDACAFVKGPGGFDGIILSEWQSFFEDATGRKSDSVLPEIGFDALLEAVDSGRIGRDRIDDAVSRVLRVKFRLGLLSAIHMSGRARPANALPTPVHNREVAIHLAKRCAVLLRNEPELLPLGIDSGDILLVGNAANDRRGPLAGARGIAASVLDGFEQLGVPHRFVTGLALRREGAEADGMIAADNMAIGMACEAAKRAGTVIFVHGSGGDGTIGEADGKLLSALLGANRRLVLVSLGPRPIDPLVDGERLPAVLHAGQLGTMSGHAVAELLTGEASPSGKLPFSMPAQLGSQGLPVGHGLTYSDFALTDLSVEIARDRICLFADLRNMGEREATETVQLYLRPVSSSPDAQQIVPMRLVDFQRVRLKPGARETLIFECGRQEFGRYCADGKFRVDPGSFGMFLGLSSARGMPARVEVTEQMARAMAGWELVPVAGSTQLSA